MSAINLNELYEKYIRPLPTPERRRLAEMISRDIADVSTSSQRSLLQLERLGQHLWQGVDPQQYVNELRDEWEHRP